MTRLEQIIKSIDELIDQLHDAKELGALVSADRLWFRLSDLFSELRVEIENILKHPIGNMIEISNLTREHIEYYAKESKVSARRLLHSAIIRTIKMNEVPDFDDDHHCSCEVEGVDEDFHCEYYGGCIERDNLDCVNCPIYKEYIDTITPEWVVDGVCTKEKTHPEAICELGYACDGCPYFPDGQGDKHGE